MVTHGVSKTVSKSVSFAKTVRYTGAVLTVLPVLLKSQEFAALRDLDMILPC